VNVSIFRGKHLGTGDWIYGYYNRIKCNDESYISYWGTDNQIIDHDGYHVYQIAEETLGQFTGKKDSQNNNIYEGDIVQIKIHHKIKTVEVKRKESEWVPLSKYCKKRIGFGVDECKVIGNVHDNPELLI
jgi:uncharacterized phage protein (TIGR01671 family)